MMSEHQVQEVIQPPIITEQVQSMNPNLSNVGIIKPEPNHQINSPAHLATVLPPNIPTNVTSNGKGHRVDDDETTLETNAENGWDKDSLADALGLSSEIRQIDIVHRALEVLKSSHINPAKVNNVSQRKRQDYNCGKCGKRKKGHDCDGNETPQEPSPSPKRRKYKPLQPLLTGNLDPNTQSDLLHLAPINPNTITVRLRISNDGLTPPDFDVVVEAAYNQRGFIYIGKLSTDYKNLVRTAIEDNSITKVQLDPIRQMQLPDGRGIWTTTLSVYRTQSWHTKKLTEHPQI